MKKDKIKLLINNIDWEKDWDDLSDNEKANFLGLHSIGFLNAANKMEVMNMYLLDKEIIDFRGTENLYLYI